MLKAMIVTRTRTVRPVMAQLSSSLPLDAAVAAANRGGADGLVPLSFKEYTP